MLKKVQQYPKNWIYELWNNFRIQVISVSSQRLWISTNLQCIMSWKYSETLVKSPCVVDIAALKRNCKKTGMILFWKYLLPEIPPYKHLEHSLVELKLQLKAAVYFISTFMPSRFWLRQLHFPVFALEDISPSTHKASHQPSKPASLNRQCIISSNFLLHGR